jgi:prolyl-tRNA editing enzyme YbaK/EbsC (Cys-tRNA(Pro) deacylase)
LRSFTDVHDDLTARCVPHEIVHLPSSSRTAQLAAAALDVPVGDELTGYEPGAVPPSALATEVPVVADQGVFAPDVVYCGGGTTTTMLKIRSADLDALLGSRKLPIARR